MVAAEIFTATLSATNIQKGAQNVYTSIPRGYQNLYSFSLVQRAWAFTQKNRKSKGVLTPKSNKEGF